MSVEAWQFELYGQKFGGGTDAPLSRVDGFGADGLRERRYEQGDVDGAGFGVETRDGRTLTFEGAVVRPGDPGGTWSRAEDLARVFDAPATRAKFGAVLELQFQRPGGEPRAVFGRPDRLVYDTDRMVIGMAPFTAAFRCHDRTYYSVEEASVRLGIVALSDAYIVTDEDGYLVDPITTTGVSRRPSLIVNRGDADTWPVITIGGPIANPSVSLRSGTKVLWTLQAVGSVAHGQELTIDTRPWSRGMSLGGVASSGLALTASSQPSLASLPPGEHELIVAGSDPTGTAHFDVRWRHGHRRP